MILSRLSVQPENRWNRNTPSRRRDYARQQKLIDFVNFVENEMKVLNGLLYSRNAVIQYIQSMLQK